MSAPPLGLREVAWVTCALLLALAPHMQRFPVLLSVAFLGAAFWRLLGATGRAPLPDREHAWLWVGKQFVAVLAFLTIYIAYHGQLGREAGVELLAALLGLKLLEMRVARDYYIVTFLCYFLVVTNFFYSQTLSTAVYMLFVVVVVTAVLVQFNTPREHRHAGRALGLAATMTAQALPLMLVAFVLFPRLPGPLWGLPQDAFDAVSGLSEDMTVGEIARLGLSDEIAFRVEFHGAEPRTEDLYWRGPVLWNTTGRTWLAGKLGDGPAGPVEALGPRYRYTVTLEPHSMRWLMGLDLVTTAGPEGRRTADHRLLAKSRVTRRVRYDLVSATDYRTSALSDEEREAALRLPPGWHAQARALAAQWAAGGTAPLDVVKRALGYFGTNGFVYSLTPPRLPGDAVDDFLLDTREGFCEHFAAAFVVLMRAAGIPARVVTGYQGGEYNNVGRYLVVRQRDAHAWAEVYFEGDGWVRVDPTAVVAPERLSLGIGNVLPRTDTLSALADSAAASALWQRLRDSLDAVTYAWNQWVLGYSPQRQRRLLDELGFEDWDYGNLVMALTVLLALVTTVLAVLLLRAERAPVDPARRAYARFCDKLARQGLERAPAEPPLAFAARVARQRADLAREVEYITRLYAQTRYGRVSLDPRRLERRVARFRPRQRA